MAIDQWVVKAIYVWVRKTERVSEDRERRERSRVSRVLSNNVMFFYVTDVSMFLTPAFIPLLFALVYWQTRHILSSYKVTPCLLPTSLVAAYLDIRLENVKWNVFVRACVFRCVCACHRAYTSGTWGWFKVPFRCVRTAFRKTLVMQKMLSSSASLFV